VCCAAAGCARLAKAAAGAGRLFCADHQNADEYWTRVPCLLCLSTQHAVRDCVIFREKHVYPPPPEHTDALPPPPGLCAQLRSFFAPPAARWHCTRHADGLCFWYRAPVGARGVRCLLSAPGAAVRAYAAHRVEGSPVPWWALALPIDQAPKDTQHAWCADMPGLGESAYCAKEPVPPLAALRIGPPRTAVPLALAASAAGARGPAVAPGAQDPAGAAAERDEAFASAARELHELAVDDAFVYVAMEATAAKYKTCAACPDVLWLDLSATSTTPAAAAQCTCNVPGIFAVRGAENWHRACVYFALFYAAVTTAHSPARAHAAAALQVLWEWARSQYPPGTVSLGLRRELTFQLPDVESKSLAHSVLHVFMQTEQRLHTLPILRAAGATATEAAAHSSAVLEMLLHINPAVGAALLTGLCMRAHPCWVVPFVHSILPETRINPFTGSRVRTNRALRIRAHVCTALDYALVDRATAEPGAAPLRRAARGTTRTLVESNNAANASNGMRGRRGRRVRASAVDSDARAKRALPAAARAPRVRVARPRRRASCP